MNSTLLITNLFVALLIVGKLIPAYNIRPYQQSDVIRPLLVQNATSLGAAKQNHESFIAITQEFLQTEQTATQVCVHNNQLIGFINYSHEGCIMLLAVDQEYRRQGIGKVLLTTALEDMQHHGVTTAFVSTPPNNCEAQALYQKNGFVLEKSPFHLLGNCSYKRSLKG